MLRQRNISNEYICSYKGRLLLGEYESQGQALANQISMYLNLFIPAGSMALQKQGAKTRGDMD